MIILYVLAAAVAIPVALRAWGAASRRWRRARLLPLAALLLAACDAGGLLEVEDAGADGGGGSSTTIDECGGACVAPQVCGIGCGEAPGCYTPGGSLDGGPNDCPSCFAMFDHNDMACGSSASTGHPYAFYCQPKATPLGGCITSTAAPGYECCPPGPDGGAP